MDPATALLDPTPAVQPADVPRVHAVPPPAPAGRSRPRLALLLLVPAAFAVYAASFSDRPVLERRHSVLGDADAANFVVLLERFSPSAVLGNPYNVVHRSLGDNAQKHKIHHVLYAAAGSAVLHAARPAYRAAGVPERRAVYAVNALLAVLNLALLAALLRGANPHGNPRLPFLLFFAASLSTWVFYSVPESWPFSATLVLAYLLALRRPGLPAPVLGALLGVVMLNNVYLAALGVLVVTALVRRGARGWALARGTAAAAAASVAAWCAGLGWLSLYDPAFRPDRFVRFTLWFKQYVGAVLPRTDPYVWKSAASNLFVNSVVANQPDPSVPQEALAGTLRSGPLGVAALLLWLAVAALVAGRAGRRWVAQAREGGWAAPLADPAADAPVWCVAMLLVTVVLFYPSGFLYSTVVLPLMALALCREMDLRVPWERLLLFALLAAMIANNLNQVLQFRAALRTLA